MKNAGYQVQCAISRGYFQGIGRGFQGTLPEIRNPIAKKPVFSTPPLQQLTWS